MIGLVARLSRSLPLVIALVVLAFVIYFVVSYRRTPTRAKEVLIQVFTVICSIISIFFILASLYALLDGNQAVFELAASFAGVGVVGLIITLICKYFFKKHHPHYKYKATVKATTQEASGVPSKGTLFWKIYDLLGYFKPKK